MARASIQGGKIVPLSECYVKIQGEKIVFHTLPDLSDQKSASWSDVPVIGRASPLKTYSHSENRAITLELYFHVVQQTDVDTNLSHLRLIESAVYPQDNNTGGAPFLPPPICSLKCGKLLDDNELCCVLRSYSVKFPRDVPWDADTYLPWSFQVSTNWEAVYKSEELPGQQRIAGRGGNGFTPNAPGFQNIPFLSGLANLFGGG